jgi:hypothetical protein
MDGSSIVHLKNQLAKLKGERDELGSDVMEERNIISGME